MKFSLTVDSPREAGYATSMFRALQSAMISEPPPAVRSKTETTAVGDISQSLRTDYVTGVSDIGKEPGGQFALNVEIPLLDVAEFRIAVRRQGR